MSVRKLANTFVRAGTWRIIDICSKPKVKDGKKYAVRVEENGDIYLYESVDLNIKPNGGGNWRQIHHSGIEIPEDVPEERVELQWEDGLDFDPEDGTEHKKLCNVEYKDGTVVEIRTLHHASNRGSDYEYYTLWIEGRLAPKSSGYRFWLYGDVEEVIYNIIEKRGYVVKPPVRGVQS